VDDRTFQHHHQNSYLQRTSEYPSHLPLIGQLLGGSLQLLGMLVGGVSTHILEEPADFLQFLLCLLREAIVLDDQNAAVEQVETNGVIGDYSRQP